MKSGSHVSFVILLLALAAVACQQDGETARGLVSETRDSAGIQKSWKTPARLTARVCHGKLAPNHPSRLASTKARSRTCSTMPATRQSCLTDASSWRMAAATSCASSIGRGPMLGRGEGQGEGPGEFTALGPVERWSGDSIMAWWAPRRAISVFDSDGNFGRTFKLESNDDDPIWIFLRPISVAGGGTILSTLEPEGVDTVVVELRDGEGRLKGSLGTHLGSSVVFQPPLESASTNCGRRSSVGSWSRSRGETG